MLREDLQLPCSECCEHDLHTSMCSGFPYDLCWQDLHKLQSIQNIVNIKNKKEELQERKI